MSPALSRLLVLVLQKYIKLLFTSLGQSLLEKTVPSVLSNTLAYRIWRFFSIWTFWLVNDLYVFWTHNTSLTHFFARQILWLRHLTILDIKILFA